MADFAQTITTAYAVDGAALDLGRGVHDGAVVPAAAVKLPLQFQARGFPVEFLSLGGIGPGVPVRATVLDFGPQLLAKVLGANETQEQSLSLTSMGIGEAAVTILSESGVPTPVVHTRVVPPASRMGPADNVAAAAQASPLWAKYGTRVDNQSAREILAARVAQQAEAAPAAAEPPPAAAQHQPAAPPRPAAAEHEEAAGALAGGVAAMGAFLQSKQGKQLQKEVVRGVFGMLKKRL